MKIAAAEFKANCLRLMDEVARTRRVIVITKRGRPVAQLIPADEAPSSLFGYMKGTVTIKGDVTAPLAEKWSALSGTENRLYGAEGGRRRAKRRGPRK